MKKYKRWDANKCNYFKSTVYSLTEHSYFARGACKRSIKSCCTRQHSAAFENYCAHLSTFSFKDVSFVEWHEARGTCGRYFWMQASLWQIYSGQVGRVNLLLLLRRPHFPSLHLKNKKLNQFSQPRKTFKYLWTCKLTGFALRAVAKMCTHAWNPLTLRTRVQLRLVY